MINGAMNIEINVQMVAKLAFQREVNCSSSGQDRTCMSIDKNCFVLLAVMCKLQSGKIAPISLESDSGGVSLRPLMDEWIMEMWYVYTMEHIQP